MNPVSSRFRAAVPDAGHEIGLSPKAQALRLAVQNLAAELRVRCPELVAKSDRDSFGEALRHITVAGNLLALHAALARRESLDTLVSMRDAMAAEHLVYISEREQTREHGKVLVFLHSIHLRRTKATLPWYEFWPTGSHLEQTFGARFAAIGAPWGRPKQTSLARRKRAASRRGCWRGSQTAFC
ncbi:hypothetical protein AJ88_24210 [Mesorhizobium amorphae CCBAU 01583]|nr:hypothetical protein AJ88_24210 [Mesorhizobium amorphae CCBAU 01583]